MAFNVITGEYDADGPDLSGTYSDSVGYVQPDVSQGAPNMSPSTPTGNGTGYYVEPAQSSTSDLLTQALNLALTYEQHSLSNRSGVAPVAQMSAIQSQQAQNRQKNTMFLILVGLAVFAMVEEQ